jgi:hypothetical protein
MLRKLKWQTPWEPLAAPNNWCQDPVPGRGPAVEKHCYTVTRIYRTAVIGTCSVVERNTEFAQFTLKVKTPPRYRPIWLDAIETIWGRFCRLTCGYWHLEIMSLLKSAHHVMYVRIWATDSTHPWTRAGGELHALISGFLIQGKVSPLSKIYVFCSVSPVDC